MTTLLLLLVTTCFVLFQSWFGVPSESSAHTPVVMTVFPATTTAKVTRVIDGDTVAVQLSDGTNVHVRYIGINTPEIYPSVECGGNEASARNSALVAGKTVTLISGSGRYDTYGRRLAYVYVNGLSVNEILLREGLAELMMIPPNTEYRTQFEIIEASARSKKVGIWRCPERSVTH